MIDRACAGVTALALLGWAMAPAVAADSVEAFYAGKTLTIVAGVSPGGVYDIAARILARHMSRHVPGAPKIIVQNMTGGGGLVAANYMFNVAQRDGTVMSVPLSGIVVDQLLRSEHVKYDAAQFSWIGLISTFTDTIAVLDTAPAKTLADAKRVELVIGTSGKGSQIYQEPALMNAILGTKFKLIEGYRGGPEITLAMERGEVHGRSNVSTSWAILKPEWVREGRLVHLIQIGPRDPSLGDVPTFLELARTPREKAMVEVLHVSLNTGRAVYSTPKVLPERVAALRRAFELTMTDPEYRREMESQKMDLLPKSGAALQAYVEATLGSEAMAAAAAEFKAALK